MRIEINGVDQTANINLLLESSTFEDSDSDGVAERSTRHYSLNRQLLEWNPDDSVSVFAEFQSPTGSIQDVDDLSIVPHLELGVSSQASTSRSVIHVILMMSEIEYLSGSYQIHLNGVDVTALTTVQSHDRIKEVGSSGYYRRLNYASNIDISQLTLTDGDSMLVTFTAHANRGVVIDSGTTELSAPPVDPRPQSEIDSLASGLRISRDQSGLVCVSGVPSAGATTADRIKEAIDNFQTACPGFDGDLEFEVSNSDILDEAGNGGGTVSVHVEFGKPNKNVTAASNAGVVIAVGGDANDGSGTSGGSAVACTSKVGATAIAIGGDGAVTSGHAGDGGDAEAKTGGNLGNASAAGGNGGTSSTPGNDGGVGGGMAATGANDSGIEFGSHATGSSNAGQLGGPGTNGTGGPKYEGPAINS